METVVKGPKDFWTGLIYVMVGIAALWFGSEYPMGTAGRMGPGYFPKVLAVILLLLGIASLVRSFLVEGPPVSGLAFTPLLLVLGACALFGFIIPRLGLAAGLVVLCVMSAAASDQFRFDPKIALGLVGLIIVCGLVFVKGLGVPIPLLGTWLEPTLGPIFPWLR